MEISFPAHAEREGFEPSVPVRVHTLSRRAPSTARAPLLIKHLFNAVGRQKMPKLS